MKATVIVGFTDGKGFTHLKGEVVDFDDTYITKLIERGRVQVVEDTPKTSKRKSTAEMASKNNARKNILSRRGRR